MFVFALGSMYLGAIDVFREGGKAVGQSTRLSPRVHRTLLHILSSLSENDKNFFLSFYVCIEKI